jgi:MarR family transcriptional regulator, multiple antibiotic resistance protein MarR
MIARADMSEANDPKTGEIHRGIGRLLGRVHVELTDALDAELAPFDISKPQYVILAALAEGGVDSASGLCRGVSYDPGAMTRMIDRLEQKGLIRRTAWPEDRRKAKLELTAEGKAVYPKLTAAASKVMGRCLRGFSRTEQRQLHEFLERILANA